MEHSCCRCRRLGRRRSSKEEQDGLGVELRYFSGARFRARIQPRRRGERSLSRSEENEHGRIDDEENVHWNRCRCWE